MTADRLTEIKARVAKQYGYEKGDMFSDLEYALQVIEERGRSLDMIIRAGDADIKQLMDERDRLHEKCEKIEKFRRGQYERIPAVPHSQPGSYDRGYNNGMADILRGLSAALEESK